MVDEQTLLARIAADPEDAAAREVYADWLDEAGRTEEGDRVRAQLALSRVGPPALPPVTDVARALRGLQGLVDGWRLPEAPDVGLRLGFAGGRAESLRVEFGRLPPYLADALAERVPHLRALDFTGQDLPGGNRWVESVEEVIAHASARHDGPTPGTLVRRLPRLRALELHDVPLLHSYKGELERTGWLADLPPTFERLHLPHPVTPRRLPEGALPALQELSFGTSEWREFRIAPWVRAAPNVRRLTLAISPADLPAIADWPLERLVVSGSDVELGRTPGLQLSTVKELVLRAVGPAPAAGSLGRALGPFSPLEALSVHNYELGAYDRAQLRRLAPGRLALYDCQRATLGRATLPSVALESLVALKLGDNERWGVTSRRAELRALGEMPRLEALFIADLSAPSAERWATIGAALAELPALRTLSLHSPAIEEALPALAALQLRRLQCVNLDRYEGTHSVLPRLHEATEALDLPGLEWLELSGCTLELPPERIRALREHPSLRLVRFRDPPPATPAVGRTGRRLRHGLRRGAVVVDYPGQRTGPLAELRWSDPLPVQAFTPFGQQRR